ncbi:single-stranded-DNA-specific exonuclease RecJ [Candidatus Saccharibacteria bacterium]|nr:single-stranded-DNA-specific exonuclease RecJ [Candidatus Saccharibacteria bacterium]
MQKIIWDYSKAFEIDSDIDVPNKLLAHRGLSRDQAQNFLEPDYNNGLSDPFALPGMDKAVRRILRAIKAKEKIVIYGDYDIDGLSASALLYDALTTMGVEVGLYIPDRFEEGYGLNSEAIKKLKKQKNDLIITVDCGTTAHEQAKVAQKIGIDLIITDHHEPDGGIPKGAIACVNPKLDKKNKLEYLAGVGVAFYLVRALQTKTDLLKPGHEKWLLDLVALGTICDVVPLVGDNRILASYGLRVLKMTHRQGLLALAKSSMVDIKIANEIDLGFKIGPRLNAAGRLAHAQKALDLLITKDPQAAEAIALELGELNYKRQQATKEILAACSKQASRYKRDPILVLSDPEWSHGVVGIVASKISEKWHKPTIILQELGEVSKGSARSYGTFDIIKAIRSCEDFLESCGGHSFAAGLKLKTDRLTELRYRINQYAAANMDVKNNFRTLTVGVNLSSQSANIKLYDEITQLAPFGNANKRPYLMGRYEIVQIRLVGDDSSHLRLQLVDTNGNQHTAIGFGMASSYRWLENSKTIELVFELSENIWQNKRQHQLEIIDIRPYEH